MQQLLLAVIGIYLINNINFLQAQEASYIHYTTKEGLASMQVYDLAQCSKGYIWLVTDVGVSRFDGVRFTHYSSKNELPAYILTDFEQVSDHYLWLFNNKEDIILRYQLNRLRPQNANDSSSATFLPNKQQYFKQPISASFVENDSVFWLGTWGGGAYRVTKTHVGNYSLRPFLAEKTISAIFKDREHNYWFSTLEDGVFLLLNPNAITYNTLQQLPSNNIVSLAQKSDTELWLGTARGQLVSLHTGTGKTAVYSDLNADERTFNRIHQIHTDSNNNHWLATDEGFKLLDANNNWFLIDVNPTKSLAPIANKNEIWVGSYQQPYLFNTYLGKESLRAPVLNTNINDIFYQAANEQLLLATNLGTYTYQNPNQLKRNTTEATSKVLLDAFGRTWILTADQGIYLKKGQTMVNIRQENGLNSNNCRSIFMDKKNNAWIGTNNGLHKLSINNLAVSSLNISTFTTLDGLASNLINDVLVMNDSVWVATNQGLSLLPIHKYPKPKVAPLINIQAVVINNTQVPIRVGYPLAYYQNNISISFAGLSFKSGSELQYVYKMLNVDKNWSYTQNNTVDYPSLPPGKHTFVVNTIDRNGNMGDKNAVVNFNIRYPYWQQWWFIILSSLAILSGIVAGIWGYIRYQNERNSLKRRMVESEQLALRTQMNPHFIYNSLNAIQYFIMVDDKTNANQYLSVFAELIRRVLKYSQQFSITLEEEIEYLGLYLQIESLRFKQQFSYTLHTDSQIDLDEFRIPPMLIQPHVENAIQHGLLPKQNGDKTLYISFSKLNEASVRCAIKDNGIGRQQSYLNSRHKHTGIGTTNTKKRIELLNSLANNNIQWEIIDEYNQQNEAVGTSVLITFTNVAS